MSPPAIKVQGLWKEYDLGETHGVRPTLYEAATRALTPPWKRNGAAPLARSFWALRDIDVDVQPGEVVGVIGRNGAGKSTLLKILSRITAPTRGRIEIRGRIASLLEVGTGFHPELTGRENIFLNAAILGMPRREVLRKFDDIVAFAEIDEFIDTPVKRYSSGMYVRLAFAVAAHLEPDVLVVDEVLAVGDRLFQEKCLGRMNTIARSEGRTVLFVSHNLDAVTRICGTGLYLRSGAVAARGDILSVVQTYVARGNAGTDDLSTHDERWGDGQVRIQSFALRDAAGREVAALTSGADHELVIRYEVQQARTFPNAVASIAFADARGLTVMLVSSDFSGDAVPLAGRGEIVCRIPNFNLAAGTYSVTLHLGQRGDTFDCLNDAIVVDVVGGDFFGTGHAGLPEHCRTLTRSAWSTA